jgi:hypothetical protein
MRITSLRGARQVCIYLRQEEGEKLFCFLIKIISQKNYQIKIRLVLAFEEE